MYVLFFDHDQLFDTRISRLLLLSCFREIKNGNVKVIRKIALDVRGINDYGGIG